MKIANKYLRRIVLLSGLTGFIIGASAQSDSSWIDSFLIPSYNSSTSSTTAPVTIIKGATLEKTPSFDLEEALCGWIPNGEFQWMSSRPGSDKMSMEIRGSNYLVLVDGVPRPLSEVSAFEIESVNVLRGLSSTAMFGTEARNGIVYIQTKRGNEGESYIDFDLEYGISSVNKKFLPDWLNSYNYASLYNEASLNDGLSAYYSGDALSYYQSGEGPLRYPDEDIYEQVFNKNMAYRRVNLRHGGGTEKVQYFINMNYQGEGNRLYKINSLSADMIGLRSNLDVKISEFLSLNAGVFGNLDILKSPNPEDQVWPVLGTYPSNAYPVLIAADTFGTSENYRVNPVGDLTNHLKTTEYDMSGRFDVGLDFDFSTWVEGLNASIKLAYDINTIAGFIERPDLTYAQFEPIFYGDNVIPDSLKQYGLNNPSAGISQNQRNYQNQFFNVIKLGYKKQIGRNRIETGLVNSINNRSYYWKDTRSQDYKKQDLSLSLFYSFANRYQLDFIMSYSGLMNLPADKRFRLFPTIGAGWVLSEEAFLSDSKMVDFLKLRASYGTMGYYNSDNAFLYQTFWGEGPWTVFNNRTESSRANRRGTLLLQYGNENIDWAVQKELNLGLDSRMLNNKLAVSLDYYTITREGIILMSPIPSIIGTQEYQENIGSNRYSGFDIAIEYRSSSDRDFTYSVGLNSGYNKSEVIKSNDLDYPYEWMKREGNPGDAIYGLVADGLLSENDIQNPPQQSFGLVYPGNIKYKDLNQDGVVQGTIDEQMIGHSSPRFNYGININLRYRNIGFYLMGYGLADYDINTRNNPYYYAYGSNKYSGFIQDNRWTPGNPDPLAKHPRLTTGNSDNDNRNSSYWLVDGSYFSIKSAEIVL